MSDNVEVSTESTISLDAASVVTRTWGADVPQVVLLHDGLGSIEQWRDVPQRIADVTGLTVMAYDRPGHGRSKPTPTGPWPADWLHREATLLREVLDETGAADPVLVGHSDGGSIAAIHAATTRSTGPLILLAAHSWVETVTVDAISGMIGQRERVVAGLARYHAEPAALFDAWSGVWVCEEFASWDIRDLVGTIVCETAVVQGSADEYATPEHATSTTAAIGTNATCVILDHIGHLIHHQAPDRVADLVAKMRPGV